MLIEKFKVTWTHPQLSERRIASRIRRTQPPPDPIDAVVALLSGAAFPFANLSGDPAQDYFADGIIGFACADWPTSSE